MACALFLWFGGILKPIVLLLCCVVLFHRADVYFSHLRLSQFNSVQLHSSEQNLVQKKSNGVSCGGFYVLSNLVCVHGNSCNFSVV